MKVEWRRLRDEQPNDGDGVWVCACDCPGKPMRVERGRVDEGFINSTTWGIPLVEEEDKDDDPVFWAPMELPDPPEVGT